MIEDALRETFAAKAGEAPVESAGEQAQRFAKFAMLRARRIRHRRIMTSALAGVLIVAMVGLATFHFVTGTRPAGAPMADGQTVTDPDSPSELPPPSAAERPVPDASAMPAEVASNGEIYTEGKSRVQLKLPKEAEASSVYKSNDGYLVVADLRDEAEQLLLVDNGGNKRVLIESAVRIVISPKGDRVAWLADGLLSVAARRTVEPWLDTPRSVTAPALTVPVAFLGVNVVLARSKADGSGTDGYDLWYPAHSDGFVPSWDTTVLGIFGSRTDGDWVYAQLADPDKTDRVCVALLAADQPFKLVGKACGLPRPASDDGGISPDGRWLAYPMGDDTQIAMLDLSVPFAKTWKAQVYDIQATCVRTYWLAAKTFVADTGTKFVTLDPTAPSKVETAQGTSEGKVLIEPLRS